MRKNKTWEISLTNNSRLVANEPIDNAVVYTTDTEAYLNFRITDSGFEFDSATIAMLNKDDGSIVERPMTKEDDTAVYEVESDIIPHFGLWQAQVLFKQGEEIFTSTPVTFVIERYMGAEQPPRLEDVANWKRLYDNATETINELTRINDELTTTNETVQQAEAQRVLAENERSEKYGSYAQQFNDVITDLSEEKDYNSLPEISAARGGHDTLGQRLDETTAQLAHNTQVVNDAVSKVTVDSEVILARDGHTTLNARLDSEKARLVKLETGRVELDNIAPKTLSDWLMIYNTATLSNNEYNLTVTNNLDSLRIESRNLTPIVGHKYYITHETRPSVNTGISTHIGNAVHTVQGNKDTHTIITAVLEPVDSSPLRIYVRSTVASIGDIHRIRNIKLIDLTEVFGVGNEPTKLEMDELFKITGYFEGKLTLTDKLRLNWMLKLIRKHSQAIIALGGTI